MMLTKEVLLAILPRLITALTGTLGFALVFRVGRRNLPWAAFGGLLTYIVYEFTILFGGNELVAAFAASLFMSLYSEAMARILHAPTVIFLFPCAIPIVPGGALYYTMYNLLFYNEEKFFTNAESTLTVALGIAVGMSVASIVVGSLLEIRKRIPKNSAHG